MEQVDKSAHHCSTLYHKSIQKFWTDCVLPFRTALAKGTLSSYELNHFLHKLPINCVTTLINGTKKPSQDLFTVTGEDDGINRSNFMEWLRLSNFGYSAKESFPFNHTVTYACWYGDENILDALITNGNLNPFVPDKSGNNVIHDLVRISKFKSENAIKYYKIIIKSLIKNVEKQEDGIDIVRSILECKNYDNITPIQLAINEFEPCILLEILNTEPYPKKTVQELGLYRVVWYDMTSVEEHETCDDNLSLILTISLSTVEDAKALLETEFLDKEPLRSYSNLKWKTYYWRILIWSFEFLTTGFLHLIHIILFITIGVHRIPSIFLIFLLLANMFVIFAEIISIGITVKVVKPIIIRNKARGLTMASSNGYSHLPTIASIMSSVGSLIVLFNRDFCYKSSLKDSYYVLHISIMALLVLNILYISQISPFGHLLITIMHMMKATASYFALMLGVIMAFGAGLAIMYKKPNCPGVVSHNATIAFPESLYYAFLLSTTALVPKDKFFSNSYSPIFTVFLYVSSVIVVYLTLANLLIAVMSRRVNKLFDKIMFIKAIARYNIISLFDETTKIYYKSLCYKQWGKEDARLSDIYKYFKLSEDRRHYYIEAIETVKTDQQIDDHSELGLGEL
ncbi:unnamed protein product [Dimorphilus gyrociliatus]|uniref:Uncharacterized protein n=1 Tax=Dimorphilus gyrociliatus TaxID=2664684 RepID=A0A7I8W4U9_9ANNE|nr:unnamed protein product [Dimorphilus gyrociliatus]